MRLAYLLIKGSCAFADLKYDDKDSISPSTLIFAVTKGLLMTYMTYFVQLERSSSFIQIKWIKNAVAH